IAGGAGRCYAAPHMHCRSDPAGPVISLPERRNDRFGHKRGAPMGTDSGPEKPEPVDVVEVATRWGLVALAAVAVLGALLRVFAPGPLSIPERLDQTTLLYLGVAGGLLLLRQVKAFSLGQLKFEMIEKIAEQQQKQAEKLADIAL